MWNEARSLYDFNEDKKNYIIKQDEDQNSFVYFGGLQQKPSFKNDMIEATYRTGLGLGGLVKENQLSIILDRPLGLKNVTNPLPSKDGVDPEGNDSIRTNLALPILTLERIISVPDFENFAKAYVGISKAKATRLRINNHELVHITVVPSDKSISTEQIDLQGLNNSINLYKDYTSKFKTDLYNLKLFNISAKISVLQGYNFEIVKEDIVNLLQKVYSFEYVSLSESVQSSMILGLIQSVDGVEAVDLDSLYIVNPEEPSFTIDLEDVLNSDTDSIYDFVKEKSFYI